MVRLLRLYLALLLLAGPVALPASRASAAQPGAQMQRVIVRLVDQPALKAAGPGEPALAPRLRAYARRSQARLAGRLAALQAAGQASAPTLFWIFNGFALNASPAALAELAGYPEVADITPDALDLRPAGLPPAAARPARSAAAGEAQESLHQVRAVDLWRLGARGQGVVVALLDSGVSLASPDLARSWRGGANSWFDPYGEHPLLPVDRSGHGTQVLGLIVGGAETSAGGAEISAGGAAIGVAPQARWIAARVFDDRGRASAGAVHLAFQWLLDPDGDPATPDAPQVVNASWAFGAPGCNLEFQPDLQALQAAGITAVFAAGNYGPEPASSPSPANYPEALAVGAVDHYDLPYLYSSRGPAECGGTRPAFPDLVAPGVDLRTTDLSGLYTTASGTSLAAPHAAGGLALLLSHFPTLTLADRRQALLAGTYPLSETIPDPSFGYGRLDLLAAYRWVQNTARYPAPPIPRLYLPLIEK